MCGKGRAALVGHDLKLFDPLNDGGPVIANVEDILSFVEVEGRMNVAAVMSADGVTTLVALIIDADVVWCCKWLFSCTGDAVLRRKGLCQDLI